MKTGRPYVLAPSIFALPAFPAALRSVAAISDITATQRPQTCPVTKPYQASLYVPPYPYLTKAPSGSFWFGTDRLWTALPVNGTWSGLPHYTPSDPTFRQKLFFYRQGYDWRSDPRPKLFIKGKRLDAPAVPLLSDDANNGMVRPDQPFIVTGVNFPTLGCWEVTARYKDDALTFVVWVAP
jgi:hypothetical protein